GLNVGYDYGEAFAVSGDFTDVSYTDHLDMRLASLNLIFPKIFTNGVGLSTTMSYGNLNFHADGTNPRTITNGVGTFSDVPTNVTYDLTMRMAQIDLMAY